MFNNCNFLPLYLEDDTEIGKIFNLNIKIENIKQINGNIQNNNNQQNNFINNLPNNFNINQINNLNFNNNLQNNFNNNQTNNFNINKNFLNNFNINNKLQNNFNNNQINNFNFNNNLQNNINFNNNLINNFNFNNIQNNINNNFNINNNINNKSQNIINDIKEEFNSPQLIGLQNVGATCYMNATLQCFCQIKELVNYFKYKPYINTIIKKYENNNELCLTKSFKNLIENLWPSVYEYIDNQNNHRNGNNSYYAPYE